MNADDNLLLFEPDENLNSIINLYSEPVTPYRVNLSNFRFLNFLFGKF